MGWRRLPFFPITAVEKSFRHVAKQVHAPLAVYVVGGAAMAKLGIKASTKDVDLAFRTSRDRATFETALVAIGANRIHEPGTRSTRPGARHLWETPDEMGWDLFVDNVLGFQFVDADYASSEPWIVEENVEFRRLASDLVFVMKAFTPRTRDIDDMAGLLSTGAATADGIARLVSERIQLSPHGEWLSRFYHGVHDMAASEGIDVRWVEQFEEEAALATAAPLLQGWLAEKPLQIEEISKRLQEPHEATRALLERLEARGKIRRVGDRWANIANDARDR